VGTLSDPTTHHFQNWAHARTWNEGVAAAIVSAKGG